MLLREVTDDEWDARTDVAVIGGGGCGLMAAIAASDGGASVTLFEKEARLGGNSSLCSGGLNGADTIPQRDAGVRDDPESFAADIRRRSGTEARDPLPRVLAEESGAVIDWFIEEIGMTIRLGPQGTGQSARRIHYPVDEDGEWVKSGDIYVQYLERAARDRGVDIRLESPIEQLVIDDMGAVVGVACEPQRYPFGDSERRLVRAERTVVASGGFTANDVLRRRHFPETTDMVYWGAPGVTGEAIGWGEELGAGVNEEDFSYITNCHASYPEEVYLPSSLISEGAVFVNRDGERVRAGSEDTYPDVGLAVADQPAKLAAEIIDDDILEAVLASPDARKLENALDRDVLAAAEDAEEVAELTGIPSARLEAILEASELTPPYHVSMVKATIIETSGGLTIDEEAHVVTPEGEPIPRLFAGGSATEGVSGPDPSGYLPGSSFIYALAFGRIAGRTAAAEIRGG